MLASGQFRIDDQSQFLGQALVWISRLGQVSRLTDQTELGKTHQRIAPEADLPVLDYDVEVATRSSLALKSRLPRIPTI